MLASLERDGKTPGQVSAKRTRSRMRTGLIALAIVAVGGAGAFFALAPGDDAMGSSVQVAAAPRKAVAASQATATVALSSNDAASAASSAASTPAAIELATATPPAVAASAVVAAASAPAPAPAASPVAVAQAGGNPLDKLALNDAPIEPAKTRHAHEKDKDSKDKAATRPHEETVASAKKPSTHAATPAAARKARREDDADTELVAAIIARLDRRGPQPPPGASGVVVAAAPASVSDIVRRCSQNADLLEARQCRSRACENHWGKVDACPASRAPKTSQAEGGANAKRG